MRIFFIICIWSVLLADIAHAQLAQNLFIGNPKALSLGNSVTADPPGVDSIHFNPAGLSKLPYNTRDIKVITGDISIEGEFTRNDRYRELEATLGTEDPYADRKSELDSAAAYLPVFGLTDLPVLLAALGGVAYVAPGGDVTFATAAYAPLLLGFSRDDDDAGVLYNKSLGLSRITYFSPTVAWRISDSFAVGVGIGFSFAGIGMEHTVRLPQAKLGAAYSGVNLLCDGTNIEDYVNICEGSLNPFLPIFDINVDLKENFSTTFNLGLLWDVTPWLTLGLVYQSSASDELEGDINIKLADQIGSFITGLAESGPVLDAFVRSQDLVPGSDYSIDRKASFVFELPQHIAFGVSTLVFPDLRINIDVKWTEMSAWDEWIIEFDEPIKVLGLLETPISNANRFRIPRGYEDTLDWSLGVEYRVNDALSVRAGYEPRSSGIPKDKRDFLIPIGDSTLYSVGGSYRMTRESVIELALGYLSSEEYIPAGSSTNGNDPDQESHGINPSAGLDVTTRFSAIMLELSYQTRF